MRASVALGFLLVLVPCACASSPVGSPSPPTARPEDVLVWDVTTGVTSWVRDGEVIARRPEVVVAVADTLVALRMVPRTSTQSQEDDVSCGLAGEAPRLIGGLGANVSVVWAEGVLQSGVGGDVVTPRGAVFDLATGAMVALSAPDGFLDEARNALAVVCDDPSDWECEGARDGAVFAGPLALRLRCDAYGGVPELALTAVATRDWQGSDQDAATEIPVADDLGLGAIPDDVLAAVVLAFGFSDAFGFSHVSGDAATRARLEVIFRRAVPPAPAPTVPID